MHLLGDKSCFKGDAFTTELVMRERERQTYRHTDRERETDIQTYRQRERKIKTVLFL